MGHHDAPEKCYEVKSWGGCTRDLAHNWTNTFAYILFICISAGGRLSADNLPLMIGLTVMIPLSK